MIPHSVRQSSSRLTSVATQSRSAQTFKAFYAVGRHLAAEDQPVDIILIDRTQQLAADPYARRG